MKIQCITRFFYSDIKSCIDTFDIRAAVWGLEYDGEAFAVYTTTDAIKDTINREIHLHSLSFPVATLKRMYKYEYGGKCYSMPASTMSTYVAAVNRMEIVDEEQMALYID